MWVIRIYPHDLAEEDSPTPQAINTPMAENTKEIEKRIAEQDKQIKKLIAAAVQSEKRMMLLDKKLARQAHQIRNQTNMLNSIQRTLHKGGSG